MHTNRRQKTTKAFALPTVLIASVVLLTILAVSVSATTAIRNTLKNQYYAQLAQVAGEAGVAYAKACLAQSGNVPQWTDAKPLTPATDCTGTVNVGLPVRSLIVGGGGGGANTGGGGGGGGMISSAASNVNINNYYVGVGGGGFGGSGGCNGCNGSKGDQSSFNNMIAEGGGYGATHGGANGGNGGSGGGGGMTTAGITGVGGASSNGNIGGNGSVATNWNGNSGGGGGAGYLGVIGGNTAGYGNGGAGRVDDITGSAVYYAGGGGGGEVNGAVAAAGGAGGGGGTTLDAPGGGGANGLGGGGGGGSYNGNYFNGGNGGAGIVIISYPTSSGIVATGGTISTVGANRVHTFTGSGYFNVTSVGSASCPSAPGCSVTVNGNIRSSFSVPKPTVDANGRALTIANTGYVEVTRSSNGGVWRTYRQPSVQSAVVPDLCSGNATAERGWTAAVRASTQDSIGSVSSAQTITIADTALNSGQMYFRKDFNISFAGNYDLTTFTNSSQDIVDAFVDGNAVITATSGTGNASVSLTAGCHTIVVELTNSTMLARASDVTVALVKAGDALPTVVSDTTWRATAGDTDHFSETNFYESSNGWETAVSHGTWGTAALPWGAGPAAWASESGDPLAQWVSTRFNSGSVYDRPGASYAWFRTAQPFALSAVTDVRLSTYCDDACAVWVDGAVIHNITNGALASKIITLQPGQHTIGVRLNNLGAAANPSAFLLAAVDASTGAVYSRSNIDWSTTQAWNTGSHDLFSYDKTFVPTPAVLPTANVRVLVVGGGGGGGSDMGGGGGGGGVVYNGALSITPGSHRVVTGYGGTGATAGVSQPRGGSGGNSVFDDVRGYGGGGGGSEYSTDASPPGAGGSAGGSAGGVQLTRAVGVFGQGNGSALSPGSYYPTGGGGAGSAGLANPGHGGAGIANSILGTSYIFGGGGGGSGYSGIGGNGGSGGGGGGAVGATTGGTGGLSAGSPGGGGTAGVQTNTPGGNGGANTGGGGGGGSHYNSNNRGGNGGSGIVIVSYPTGSLTATGGTISTSGGYTIHRFNTVGTFDFKVISIQ